MDKVLYRYLLRRLVFYPITFSRNKNYNSYNSKEGSLAVKRAKTLRIIVNELNENKSVYLIKRLGEDYSITIKNEALHLSTEYIIDEFEKEIIKGKLINNNFDSFDV